MKYRRATKHPKAKQNSLARAILCSFPIQHQLETLGYREYEDTWKTCKNVVIKLDPQAWSRSFVVYVSPVFASQGARWIGRPTGWANEGGIEGRTSLSRPYHASSFLMALRIVARIYDLRCMIFTFIVKNLMFTSREKTPLMSKVRQLPEMINKPLRLIKYTVCQLIFELFFSVFFSVVFRPLLSFFCVFSSFWHLR